MQRFRKMALALALTVACGRPSGAPIGQTPRITPERPVAVLRAEALAATAPAEPAPDRANDLVELVSLDRTIKLDIRYATTQNFLGEAVYTQARAFLQRPAAEALVRAHRVLAAFGYGLLIHDAYRPWYVTKLFWEATPPAQRAFVADPAQGSKHNRGAAVDVTLYDRATGRAVDMPSAYDEMSARASPTYTGGTPTQRERRDLLRRTLETEGFTVNPVEWWHYDHRDWRKYGLQNVRFEDLSPTPPR
jgi:zinc D-Ala-D-Ala dipeptidase